MAIEYLAKRGYRPTTEYRVEILRKIYRVDVVGFKDEHSIAIECGHTPSKKVQSLQTIFNEVKKFRYSQNITPKNTNLNCQNIPSGTSVLRISEIGISKVLPSGKTVIPAYIRRIMGLKDGNKIVWKLWNGKMVVELA